MGEPMKLLPAAHFSTDAFEESQRFEAWRHYLPLYNVLPHPEAAAASFAGSVASYQAGPIGLGITAFSPQRYVRTRQRIAADGQDHLIVQLLTGGALQVEAADGRQVAVETGDVWVHDLARPKTVTTDACRTVSILLTRRELLGMVGAAEVDGHVLRRGTAMATLLGQHLRGLSRVVSRMTADEALAAGLGTLALTAACLRPGIPAPDVARGPSALALKDAIKDHIDAHLSAPDLDAEALCAAFRISRANLYRLFSAEGGVAAYVRHRRLERADALLRHPANAGRTIAEIAFDCGFVSEAHFSRAFRAAFAVSPREVRGTGLGPLDETVLSRWETGFRRD